MKFAILTFLIACFALVAATEHKHAGSHVANQHRHPKRMEYADIAADLMKRSLLNKGMGLLSNATSNLTAIEAKNTEQKAILEKGLKTGVYSPPGLLYVGGFATWFTQDGQAGACGNYHADTDRVVALEILRYGFTGTQNVNCGRTVLIVNTKTGAFVDAVVADACPGCLNYNSLDLSIGAFTAIAPQDEGMVPIAWTYVTP